MSLGEGWEDARLSWQTGQMRSPRRLNLGQRIVFIVGLGVGLAVFGLWATAQGSPGHLVGWTGYAPLQSSAAYRSSLSLFFNGGLHPWVQLLIWLGLTVMWTVSSILLLRSPSKPMIESESGYRPTPEAD